MSEAQIGGPYAASLGRLPSIRDIEAMEKLSKRSDTFARADGAYWRVGQFGWLWCLLFGFFYFAYHRVWAHCLISLFAAICTFGVSWLIYPIFARRLVRQKLMRQGYLPVERR